MKNKYSNNDEATKAVMDNALKMHQAGIKYREWKKKQGKRKRSYTVAMRKFTDFLK